MVLDTIHFNGGATTFDALSTGTPVVTLPGLYMRGRQTHVLYRRMGVTDCVVSTPEEYVDRAVRLASDQGYRREVQERIPSGEPSYLRGHGHGEGTGEAPDGDDPGALRTAAHLLLKRSSVRSKIGDLRLLFGVPYPRSFPVHRLLRFLPAPKGNDRKLNPALQHVPVPFYLDHYLVPLFWRLPAPQEW